MRRIVLPLLLAAMACTQQNPVLSVEGGAIQGVPSEASGVTVFRGMPPRPWENSAGRLRSRWWPGKA